MTEDPTSPFSPSAFERLDESSDPSFYVTPRLVVHIDDQAISAIGGLFREVFTPSRSCGSRGDTDLPTVPTERPVILDLMSSWRSHWPRPANAERGSAATSHAAGEPAVVLDKRMIGLGLNAVEMRHNPDLDGSIVHDVNAESCLPFKAGAFDAVVLTVSVQYLTSPVDVFRDVNRVLKPGGPFLVIFSSRMFFTKAVWIWRAGTEEERMNLVASYFRYAGNYEDIRGMYLNPERDQYEDPVYVVTARKSSASPRSEAVSQ